MTVLACAGIEGSYINSITVYPNPTTGTVNITSTINGVQLVSITNMLGEVVFSKEINLVDGYPFTVDINDEPTGIYLLRIGGSTQRIVKR